MKKFSRLYTPETNKRAGKGYITGADKKSLHELAMEMAAAQNDEDISAIASRIVNARRRNEKADKHDALIHIAEREILALEPGEAFASWTLANIMKDDPECSPYLDRDTQSHYYRTPIYKSPIGAVQFVVRKLLASGDLRMVTIGHTRAYVRN